MSREPAASPMLDVSPEEPMLDVSPEEPMLDRRRIRVCPRLPGGDAGHALSVPSLPTTDRETVGGGRFRLALGGTPAGYAAVDEDAWAAILDTLRAIRGGVDGG